MQQFASFAKHSQIQGGAGGPSEVKLQSINLRSAPEGFRCEGEVTLQLFPKPSFRAKSGQLLHTYSFHFMHTFVSVSFDSIVISHKWVSSAEWS